MLENFKTSLKSLETDDWVDIKIVRPFAYCFALLFARMGTHPNTVTILSMIIGAFSCVFFLHGSFHYEGGTGVLCNLIGFSLLLVADVLDCTDGQLARMTGKTSRLGRILDGTAGFIWFIPIYTSLLYRFYCHHDLEFAWLGIANTQENTLMATLFMFFFILYSGVVCFGGQSRIADYYIQVHLFFLKGEKGSELDTSKRQQELYESVPWKGNFVWKCFQSLYVNYTKKQERATPRFQTLLQTLKKKYGSEDNAPEEFRKKFHDLSLPVMKINGLLTFNFRTAFLILFCVLDVPSLYFVFEVVGMSLLCGYIVHRHESFCSQLSQELQKE